MLRYRKSSSALQPVSMQPPKQMNQQGKYVAPQIWRHIIAEYRQKCTTYICEGRFASPASNHWRILLRKCWLLYSDRMSGTNSSSWVVIYCYLGFYNSFGRGQNFIDFIWCCTSIAVLEQIWSWIVKYNNRKQGYIFVKILIIEYEYK